MQKESEAPTAGCLSRRKVLVGALGVAAVPIIGTRPAWVPGVSAAETVKGYLYTSTNAIQSNANAVVGYAVHDDGTLIPHEQGAVSTGGTGTSNSYLADVNPGNNHGGPNANDTPLVIDRSGTRLYVVNGGSDSIAGFAIGPEGKLSPLPGSPFPSGGVNPNSLSISKDGAYLAVSNRNQDPTRLELLRGGEANVVIFAIGEDGTLVPHGAPVELPVPTYGLGSKTAPTQVYFSPVDPDVLFVNNFLVDVDRAAAAGQPDAPWAAHWDDEELANGNLQWVKVAADPTKTVTGFVNLPDVPPAAEVGAPNIPLNVWGHPTLRLLYVNMPERASLGVFSYDASGALSHEVSVETSGRDGCWLRIDPAVTRMYQTSLYANPDAGDLGSSLEVWDVSGANARKPVEVQHVAIPPYGNAPYVNAQGKEVQGSAYTSEISSDGRQFFQILQRVNQTPENKDPAGNYILVFGIASDGRLTAGPIYARDLAADGFPTNSRAWGLGYVPA